MKKKRIFRIGEMLLALVMTAGVQAQNGVKGWVVDATTKEALPFANVVLVGASDSVQVLGRASEIDGKYEFSKLKKGKYFIQVSTIGYHRTNSSVFEMGEKTRLNLDTLFLAPSSTALEGVVVKAKKPMLEMKSGTIVMNVQENLLTQNENAYEMLKKFPGVSIDRDDNISLNGKSGVMVMIDDRPTHASGSQLANMLKAIPSTSIEKVEAITNPSSKYDAEGVGGILNLVTNKKRERGFTGGVYASGGGLKTYRHSEGFDLNYSGKWTTVYANLAYWGGSQRTDQYQLRQFSNGKQEELKIPDTKNTYGGLYGKAGADFYLSKRDVLSLVYQGNGNQYNQRLLGETRYALGDSVYASNRMAVQAVGVNQNHNVNLNYEHTFDTLYGRKLWADFTWINQGRSMNSEHRVDEYAGEFRDSLFRDGYGQKNPFNSNVYSLKFDYTHPFNMQTKLDVGAKGSFVSSLNKAVYTYQTGIDANQHDVYLYQEGIAALYAMVQHSFKTRTSLQFGLRGEYTYGKGINYGMDSTNRTSYWDIFPNVTISQPIGQKHNLSLSYRYRLSRPSYADLNPFLFRTESHSYNGGNPLLKPEYSHNLSLSYSFGYFFFATLEYTHSDGKPQTTPYFIDTAGISVTVSYPQNLGKSDRVGLSLNYQQTFFKIWRLRMYWQLGYAHTRFQYAGVWQQRDGFNSSIWMSTDVDIIPTLTAELSLWADLPSRGIYDRNPGYYYLSFAMKKTFLDKKLVLSLGIDDILDLGYKSNAHYPDGTTSYMKAYWSGRTINLRISYRFGVNTQKGKSPRQISNQMEESDRLGGGGNGGSGKP